MTDLQIGIYFIAGILTMICCGLLKKEKSVKLIQRVIAALLALAALYTILSLVYFVFMKQLEAAWAGVFRLSLHKIVIYYIDGMIIAAFLARPFFKRHSPNLLAGQVRSIHHFIRYLMAAYFICSGISKMIGFSAILQFFQLSGYAASFLYFIIAFELIFGIALLFERTAAIAALLLIMEMAGATFTHYQNYFEHQVPEPFSNSLDSLKMLPFLLVIALIQHSTRSKSIT